MRFNKLSCISLGLLVFCVLLNAEPHFALQTGLKCSQCHTNPTGGGQRNSFGSTWAVQLSSSLLSANENRFQALQSRTIGIGGNLRTQFLYQDNTDSSHNSFELEEALIYLKVELIPDRLDLYVDEKVAPDSSLNREAYGLFRWSKHNAYLKAGRFFLPFGLRLEDDQSFIRQYTGINYNNSDNGIELGWEPGNWSTSLAITNGESSQTDSDKGKQLSWLGSFIQPQWRIGASLNINRQEFKKTYMGGVFAGLKSASMFWLAEIDYIQIKISDTSTIHQWLGYLSLHYQLKKGHYIQLSADFVDPNKEVSDDIKWRHSLLYSFFPMANTEIKMGLRGKSTQSENSFNKGEEVFIRLHLYF